MEVYDERKLWVVGRRDLKPRHGSKHRVGDGEKNRIHDVGWYPSFFPPRHAQLSPSERGVDFLPWPGPSSEDRMNGKVWFTRHEGERGWRSNLIHQSGAAWTHRVAYFFSCPDLNRGKWWDGPSEPFDLLTKILWFTLLRGACLSGMESNSPVKLVFDHPVSSCVDR